MKTRNWLLIIFFGVLLFRLVLAFSTPNLTYESYFHLNQVEHIAETGLPQYTDHLSYGGREQHFLPFFHYVMAFFSLLIPLEIVAKLVPNILLAFLVVIVYFISMKITNNETPSLFSAFIAGFLPVLYATNNFAPQVLFLPLIFAAIYAFLKRNVYLYIVLFLLLTLTSSATFLLIIGFGIYLILSLVEAKKVNKGEIELIIFSLFFFIWAQFIFFKDILLTDGFGFIWQNIPPQIVLEYFPHITIIQAIVLISIIPFIAGIFVVYRTLFKLKNSKEFLLISLVISTAILVWLRTIQFNFSMAFFGLIVAILFAPFYSQFITYLKKTKFINKQKLFSQILVFILILTMIIPAISISLNQETPSPLEIDAFKWLQENTPTNAGIVSSLEEGNLITYYGKRKNLMDNQFGGIKDVEERFKHLNVLFTTPFQTEALEVLEQYGLNYLMLTPHSQERYGTTKFRFLNQKCFERVYNEETRIYQLKCALKNT